MILNSAMALSPQALNTGVDVARNPLLEEAIRERPDRPDGYLVLADWLQERHDLRGELIAVQAALAESGGDKAALAGREGELLDGHGEAFLGPNHEFTRNDATWEFGFIRSAHVMDASSR